MSGFDKLIQAAGTVLKSEISPEMQALSKDALLQRSMAFTEEATDRLRQAAVETVFSAALFGIGAGLGRPDLINAGMSAIADAIPNTAYGIYDWKSANNIDQYLTKSELIQ